MKCIIPWINTTINVFEYPLDKTQLLHTVMLLCIRKKKNIFIRKRLIIVPVFIIYRYIYNIYFYSQRVIRQFKVLRGNMMDTGFIRAYIVEVNIVFFQICNIYDNRCLSSKVDCVQLLFVIFRFRFTQIQ